MDEENVSTTAEENAAADTAHDAAVKKAMSQRKSGGGGAADPSAIGHHGHTAQFKDLIDSIKKNRQPAVDGYEGRIAVEVILAIYKAAESGRSVKLPLKSDPVLKARKN